MSRLCSGLIAMPIVKLLALWAALCLSVSAIAATDTEDDWKLEAKARSATDISLWTRTIPGAALKAFRGSTHTDAPLANAVAMLNDAPTICEWSFRCHEARIVGTADNGDTYIYLKMKGIWPVSDRDAVIRAHPVLNTRTGELVITGTAAPDYLPRDRNFVRIPAIESTWRLAPAADSLLLIEWSGHVDPGGNIPLWLANSVATLIPRYTLRQIRNLLQQPQWRTPAARDAGTTVLNQVRTQIR